MQQTVQTVTKIAFAIWPPIRPAADRRSFRAVQRCRLLTGEFIEKIRTPLLVVRAISVCNR